MKRLFIIAEPMQYLQCLELFIDEEERTLVIIGDKERRIECLINPTDWSRIINFPFIGTAKEFLIHGFLIKKFAVSLDCFDEIVTSSYTNNLSNYIISKHKKTNITLLEDGTVTFVLPEYIKQNKNIKAGLRRFIYRLAGFNVSPPPKINVFTIYQNLPIDYFQGNANKITINDFSNLKKKAINKCQIQKSDSIFIVTSNYLGLRMLKKEYYELFFNTLLEEILRLYNKRLKIFLHRFENITEYMFINNKYGIEIEKAQVPIELYFIDKGIMPRYIVTTGSGASANLSLIYGAETTVYYPDIEAFNPIYKTQMGIVLENLKKQDLIVRQFNFV